MPSGFVTRTKGKSSFGALYPLQEISSQIIKAGVAGQSTSIDPAGLTVITSTVGAVVLTLGPPDIGTYKTIAVTTMSSGAIAIKTNSTASVTFDGVNAIWKPSTVSGVVDMLHLMALSTSLWGVIGVTLVSTANAVLPSGLGTSS